MIGLVVKVAGFGVGYCYPTYSALKLLDRKAISPDDATLWLTYFMVAFSLMVSETWGVANWIPAYRLMKVLFVAWMVNPRFKGAITLYKKAIAPVFHQLAPGIDRTTEHMKKGDFAAIQQELGPSFAKVQELVKKHGPEAIEKAMNLAGKGGEKKKETTNGTSKAE